MLRQAGFGQVCVLSDEVKGVFADEEAWWASLWTDGARTPLERLAPEALEVVDDTR